ncbi:hypothetical protein JG688_00002416 [Phytophthora aleatoria]|uniref:Uncharacterized protein n=1 Tax=Phytophthora aleatoria TaxID=2496075 RepID=A0A8J5MHT8_9STRA|nr:hypothetical protein JG688_00002416 [Phytophthora aleatoria]
MFPGRATTSFVLRLRSLLENASHLSGRTSLSRILLLFFQHKVSTCVTTCLDRTK